LLAGNEAPSERDYSGVLTGCVAGQWRPTRFPNDDLLIHHDLSSVAENSRPVFGVFTPCRPGKTVCSRRREEADGRAGRTSRLYISYRLRAFRLRWHRLPIQAVASGFTANQFPTSAKGSSRCNNGAG